MDAAFPGLPPDLRSAAAAAASSAGRTAPPLPPPGPFAPLAPAAPNTVYVKTEPGVDDISVPGPPPQALVPVTLKTNPDAGPQSAVYAGAAQLPQGVQQQLCPQHPRPPTVRPQYDKALDRTMTFQQLCSTLEAVATAQARPQKLAPLERLWLELRGSDYFPFMRLLMPQLDTARATYGLKESKLAKYYVDLLGLQEQSSDAVRFKHWKDPSKHAADATHFSDVVFFVLTKRGYTAASETPLTVQAVNHHLDQLSLLRGKDEKKAVLMQLLRATSALEQKWLIRILTKEMKMQMQHTGVLNAFHPSALDTFNHTYDLQHVCDQCGSPQALSGLLASVKGEGVPGGSIYLLQPFRPMLASVVDTTKLQQLLLGEKLLVEPKYDGERMMIHKQGDTFAYWTRNAKNYTQSYGPKFDAVLRAQLPNIDTCILDGEFLLYDGLQKQFMEFGKNRTFATADVDASAIDNVQQWFCYCVFDIVFLNGQPVCDLPLLKRKDILRQVVRPKPTMIEVVPFVQATTQAAVVQELDKALNARHEGVVVKVGSSLYVPGERKQNWLKLKPDHISGMADTVDLVVLGGYFGTKYGVRRISHFLLGVWVTEPNSAPTAPGARYHTFCKVGSGYSDGDLRDMLAQLDPKWITVPPGTVPQWLDGWVPASDDQPDVFVHPKDSIVLEVYGYSFTPTIKFRVGHTIRFPRFHAVRHDKSVADATDLEQLQGIMEGSKTLAQKADAMSNLVMVRAQKRRRTAAVKAENRRLPERRLAVVNPSIMPPADVPQEGTVFLGYELCVLHSTADVIEKRELERLLLAQGGRVVANPGADTSIVLSSTTTAAKVRNWVQACEQGSTAVLSVATQDIVRVDWALECIAAGEVLSLAPRYMVHTSPELQRSFDITLDPFLDSYGEDATVDTLRTSALLATQPAPGTAPVSLSLDEAHAVRNDVLRELGLDALLA